MPAESPHALQYTPGSPGNNFLVKARSNSHPVTVTSIVQGVLSQPLASVTVTVYVPAVTPVMLAVVAALLHTKVYGEVPPDPIAVADPSLPPLQLMFVFTTELATTADGSVMVKETESEHPFASVIVTEYVPALNPLNVADACQVVPPSILYSNVPLPPGKTFRS